MGERGRNVTGRITTVDRAVNQYGVRWEDVLAAVDSGHKRLVTAMRVALLAWTNFDKAAHNKRSDQKEVKRLREQAIELTATALG